VKAVAERIRADQLDQADTTASRLRTMVSDDLLTLLGWKDHIGLLTFPSDHPQLGGRLEIKRRPSTPTRVTRARLLTVVGSSCAVVACPQEKAVGCNYCEAHERRWATASGRDSGLKEAHWRAVATAVTEVGQVSLRGLPPLIVAEALFAVHDRTRSGFCTRWDQLRKLCDTARQQQWVSLDQPVNDVSRLHSMIAKSLRQALLDPDTERHKDSWNLVAFGQKNGWLRFEDITQPWLREATKRWAADYLPTRYGGRAGSSVQSRVRTMARLSESLRLQRDDDGENYQVLNGSDITAFCNRLAFQEGNGDLTALNRLSILRMARVVLDSFRTLGLTRRGDLLDGLPDDFLIRAGQIPAHIDDDESGKDLPLEVMRLICTHLADPETPIGADYKAAIELLIDTGRRPDEICRLPFDCLTHDSEGQPVFLYDNFKSLRYRCRLPIAAGTAQVIIAQQQRTRQRFPGTPVADLKLFPTPYGNANGHKAFTLKTLNENHRQWLETLPPIEVPTEVDRDGVAVMVSLPFDLIRIQAKSYRHTYAQRHADAGVPVDVLRELMGHQRMDTTQCYYNVGEKRRREAVDRVAVMQFDRHGTRLWRDAQGLLDDERTRLALGEVAVPYGGCSEPSNVAAGGHSCPIRFRCVGCGHFRTDASYLPDLEAYLGDLLRNRERLLAATFDADDWARTEATPSDQEITRIRRLVERIRNELDDLTITERAEIEQAVALVRRGRTVLRITPTASTSLRGLRPERPPG
jgi:integrase